jgi:TonB-dependent SusC/RagA subfamily outer membrane receptor
MCTPDRFFIKGFLLLAFMVLAACTGTKNAATSNQESAMVDSGYGMGEADQAVQSNIMTQPNKDKPSNISLTEMILRLPGVRLQGGSGAYARFKVTGTSDSFMSGSDPLFVVNGNTMGTDYTAVHYLVDPRKVESVSVLKGSDASIYGSRGANGVIVIRTKIN